MEASDKEPHHLSGCESTFEYHKLYNLKAPCVMAHMSHVLAHMSHVLAHMSHFMAHMSHIMRKLVYAISDQQRHRSTSASVQSD